MYQTAVGCHGDRTRTTWKWCGKKPRILPTVLLGRRKLTISLYPSSHNPVTHLTKQGCLVGWFWRELGTEKELIEFNKSKQIYVFVSKNLNSASCLLNESIKYIKFHLTIKQTYKSPILECILVPHIRLYTWTRMHQSCDK